MSDSAPSLQIWLDHLRDGHPEARNELMRHSRERLRLLTRQMLGRFPRLQQWEDTSDVLQNALIRLDRALQTVALAGPRDFLQLATAEIRRELLDMSRQHFGPHGLGSNQVPPGQLGNAETAPEPADERAGPHLMAQWRNIHTQIAGLEELERELFELLFYQGLTQAEAAALVDLPLRTFKRRWQAARLHLMERLGGDLPF